MHRPEPEVIHGLLQMLGDRDGRCRFAAQDTLVRVGHPVVDPLIAYMRQADHDGLLGALEVALTMGDARLLGPATALVESTAPDVRARAVALLGALGSERAGARDRRRARRCCAGRADGGAAGPRGSVALARAPRRSPVCSTTRAWDVRRQAALCLRAFGPPGLLFLRRLRDSNDAVAAAVARYALDLAANGVSS